LEKFEKQMAYEVKGCKLRVAQRKLRQKQADTLKELIALTKQTQN
jgi:hypothetical protein